MSGSYVLTCITNLAAALRVLPLWIFISLALSSFAILFLPTFGGADLREFRSHYSWIPWTLSVSMTIFAAVKICDESISWIFKGVAKSRQSRRTAAKYRYYEIFSPLIGQIIPLHIETSVAAGAPYLRHRVQNARLELLSGRSPIQRGKRAWSALWDRQEFAETGEIAFGGSFPIDRIRNIAFRNPSASGDKLISLVKASTKMRLENGWSDNYLSEDDCRLINYIFQEHERLRRCLGI